jgi:hypothetical protein
VAGLVTSHLVDGVVDGVKISGLSALSKVSFALSSAILSFYADFEVFLRGRRNDLTEELSETCSVVSLFISCLLIVETYLSIALTESGAGHGKIHAYLRALTLEVGAEISLDVLRDITGNSDNMLGSPVVIYDLLFELRSGSSAYRTFEVSRKRLALIDITAYSTYKFFHVDYLQWYR